jgi:hypothetical protein
MEKNRNDRLALKSPEVLGTRGYKVNASAAVTGGLNATLEHYWLGAWGRVE